MRRLPNQGYMVLQLVAPLMAWGKPGRRDTRLTEQHPSKGSIVGLIANAMGKERDDTTAIAEIAQVKMRSFAARPGNMTEDYQTVSLPDRQNPVVIHKYYLCDAAFVVILEGDYSIMTTYAEALKNPVRILFIGRKCCLPSVPVLAGIFNKPFSMKDDFTSNLIRLLSRNDSKLEVAMVSDCTPQEADDVLMDMPIKFGVATGGYGRRPVKREIVEI